MMVYEACVDPIRAQSLIFSRLPTRGGFKHTDPLAMTPARTHAVDSSRGMLTWAERLLYLMAIKVAKESDTARLYS
jgi:hypothetical protein